MKSFPLPGLPRFADRGASMVEYCLMVSLVAVISFSVVGMVGFRTEEKFEAVSTSLDGGPIVASGESPGSTPTPSSPSGDQSGSGSGGSGTTTTSPTSASANPTLASTPSSTTTSTSTTSSTSSTSTTSTTSITSTTVAPAQPGSTSTVGKSGSEYYWFNKSKTGGEGAWKAAVTFENSWIRHQYLTLEVTRVDEKGNRSTSTVKDFYVPAGGNAEFAYWDNALKVDGSKLTGTVSVEVRVISVRTSDVNWQTVSYQVDGAPIGVKAPATP